MKYEGVLNRRIPGKHFGLLAGEPEFNADAARVTDARFAKIPALFAVHGVEIGDWEGLAFALAIEYVPGFKLSKPVGRNIKWPENDKASLRLDADLAIQTTRYKTVDGALRHLQKHSEKWKPMLKGLGTHVMRGYYYGADPRWIQMVADASAYRALLSQSEQA